MGNAYISFIDNKKLVLDGMCMPNLEVSFRALRVLDTARHLFNLYGFQNVGVDRLIEEAKIPKATFYNYFHSKERLIEVCLTCQEDLLKEEVFLTIHSDVSMLDKLKKIYFLHADLEGLYHLSYKAIFEIEKLYPAAYQMVVGYRNWLIDEIYKFLLTEKATATKKDAYLFLFVIDGAMAQLLSSNGTDERDVLLDYFLSRVC